MPKHILKLRDRYCEWSTVTDSPVSALLPFPDFCRHYAEEHGEFEMERFSERLARVRFHGTSCREPTTAHELIACNRAGPGESELTEDEIYSQYAQPAEGKRP